MSDELAMTIDNVLEILPSIILASAQHRTTVELKGPPGGGKSTVALGMPARLTAMTGKPWALAVSHPANYSPVDVIGFLIPKAGATPQDRLRSDFTAPPWSNCTDGSSIWDHEQGVLVLEELGQAESDVQKPLAELMLSGTVGPHRIPPGWFVMATSNRASDRSGVGRALAHITNRKTIISVKTDPPSWEKWAVAAGVMPEVVAFAISEPNVVFSGTVPKEDEPFCTPRSLVSAAHLARVLLPKDEHGDVILDGDIPMPVMSVIAGTIGAGAARQMLAHIRLRSQLPSWQNVIRDPHGAAVPTRTDIQLMCCYSFASKVDAKTIGPCLTYIERLPKEFSVTFVRAIISRDLNLLMTREMMAYVAANPALTALTASGAR